MSTKDIHENREPAPPLGLGSSEGLGAGAEARCWCHTCRPVSMAPPENMRMVLCPDCGNKRCPKADDHRNACTNSNEPRQPGSAYPAAPWVRSNGMRLEDFPPWQEGVPEVSGKAPNTEVQRRQD